MGLKSIKIFLLFLGLFSLAFSKPEEHNFDDDNNISGTGNQTFLIKFTDGKKYKEYFGFTLETEHEEVNPMVIISNDENCKDNRLYAGVQAFDKVYMFLKRDQIQKNQIYICTTSKGNFTMDYKIKLSNEDKAQIPYNSQASYYISDKNMESMKFTFISGSESYSSDSSVTIWLRGNHIEKPTISSLTGEAYDSAYVYHGKYSNNNLEVEVKSKVGDYVTIGSTIISEKNSPKLKENANEIMVASTEEEICFPIIFETRYILHITGKIFTRKAQAYYKDENGKIIINDDYKIRDVTNGILTEFNVLGMIDQQYGDKNGYFCLKNINRNNPLMVFALQMTTNSNLNMVHPPLYPGEFRHHFLMKHEFAIFYGMKPQDGVTEVNLNLKALKGFPEMYYDKCTTFPDCSYTEETLKNNKDLEHPYPANMMTVYSFYLNETAEYKKYNPISAFQPLMIVHCGEGYNKEEVFKDDTFCVFETSYFTNKDTVNIYEEASFSQYLLGGEDDLYKISLIGEDNLDKIYLDMMIFSGDADLSVDDFKGVANKYYLSNKIFYSIHMDNYTENSLKFSVKANHETFYMVNYQLIKKGNSDDINTIESGINYITSKYEDKISSNLTKRLDFINYGYEYNQSYLVTLLSPNCRFDVDWIYGSNSREKISSFNNSAQKIIKHTDPDYEKAKYTFEYNVLIGDMSDYNKKFCMVYASGLELTSGSADNWNGRSISLSEGVPHRYIYTQDFPVMFYAYHISNPEKTVVLNFNLIDKAYFNITIKIGREFLRNVTIYRNSQLYIAKTDMEEKCAKQEVCTVIAIVSLYNSTRDRTVELSAYQIDDNPFYLEKNAIKQDVLHGNKVKHYYFDIGTEEHGDITLDFKRGSGNIYVSVEKRNLEKAMNNPEWRGLYHFPMTNDESLKYDTYLKKVFINETVTQKCEDGCYVLISIVSNLEYYGPYEDESIPYRISINPRIYNKDEYLGNPKVKMEVNEFVIGNIDFSNGKNEKMDYYTVTLPYESPYLLFDWQSDSCSFLITVGTTRPDKDTANIKIPTIGHDYVYKIEREEILKYVDKDVTSLRGLTLTIGIYSDYPDTMNSSPYAFKIFMPPTVDDKFKIAAEIIHIRTDQKVQCLPFDYNTTNLCVFAAILDDIDHNHNLLLYPKSDAPNITIRGKLVDAERIERNDIYEIMKVMGEINTDPSCKVDKNYIYIDKIEKGKTYVFMVNENHNMNIIEILSSTLDFHQDLSVYPNPSTAQIFAIQDYTANLNFVTTKDLLVNIVCVNGEGSFYWGGTKEGNETKYYLSGFGDRLSLTTKTNDQETQLAGLKVESSTSTQIKEGFIFYITYYPRGVMDQLKEDRNTEIHYRNVIMPLNYYIPINKIYSYSISFDFYDFYIKNQDKYNYKTKLFDIWATIINNQTVLDGRYNSKELPKYNQDTCVQGVFDLTVGNLFVSSDFVNENFKEQGKDPYIFLSINKAENVPDFDTMGLEISIHSDFIMSGLENVPDGVYFNGKINQMLNKTALYSLKYDPNSKSNHFIIAEFSQISDKIQCAITTDENSEKTDYSKVDQKKENGRQIFIIDTKDLDKKLYFKIFTKEKNLDDKLDSYIFKYSLNNESSYFQAFKDQSKSELDVTKDDDIYTINLNQIQKYNASYYIKAIYKDGMVDGEKLDSIAISQSLGYHMQTENIPYKNEKQKFKLQIDKQVSYIKVIAKVDAGAQKYYIAYNPKDCSNLKPSPEPGPGPEPSDKGKGNNDDDKKTLYIIIGCVGGILLIVVIILVVFVITYRKKNKDLMGQVNKISFVQSGSAARDDDNLLLGNSEQ